MMELETRKEYLSAMKVCRFCLSQNEPLSSLYEKSKTPKNYVSLAMKIMACLAIEVFPSDKMPQYICNRCKLFMELSYGFKQVCRQADRSVLHFVQDGTLIEPTTWPSLLNKVFRAHSKAEFGVVKTITQGGATVKVMAEEISDIEEGDDDNIYNVKIGDGSEEGKNIKVITSIDKKANAKESRKGRDVDSEEMDDDPPMLVKKGCFPCDECDCTYPLEQLLTLHKLQKHRPRTVECDQCDSKFFTKHDLLTHQLRHSKEMPFQCVACDKKFKRLILLKRHEKVVHGDLPQLKCMKCPATFLSKIELDAHKMKHDGQVHQPFQCGVCDKRFSEHNCLYKHIENMHKKPGFACDYCSAHFQNLSKLGKHLRTHAGERSYPCKHCDKSFLKSHHYTRHLRVKHSEMNIITPRSSYVEATDVWRCDECDQSFNTQDDLLYHSALHATANLTCPLCQEKFKDVETVTAHIKSHVNGPEFMCDYCELIFTTQQKLNAHIANTHDFEYDKDTENDEEESMDAELEEGDESINVKEVDGHMVVEIKKAGDYMLPDTVQMEEDEKQGQSEDSEMDVSYADTSSLSVAMNSGTLLLKNQVDFPPNMPVADSQTDLRTTSAVLTPTPAKPAEVIAVEAPSIVKKAEEIKKKAIQQLPVSTSAAGTSDLSLRLLEKELQDLQRTSRNDVQKVKRHLQTSTSKSVRVLEKKDTATPKSAPEKAAPEKSKQPTRPPKEIREVKSINIMEEKDKSNVVKEEKETKDVKEKDTPKVLKNGASDKSASEEPVRRSNRASRVKDYAKMVRDSGDESEEEASESEPEAEEEVKEEDTSMEIPRRGRKLVPKPKQAPTAVAATPDSAPKKRGRPRKGVSAVPAKVAKKEDSDDEEPVIDADKADDSKSTAAAPKPASAVAANDKAIASTSKEQPTDPLSNLILSPTGHTLKQVPIKSLPPGVKPLPLPRKMTSGEVCEMQIGKKVVKVQKIVMTKAEADAMIKKGLVEMKDGTIVLKPGVKLPGTGSLKSQLMGDTETKKESPKKSLPTRCDLGE